MKVDINVEDTCERKLISQQSFIFPKNSIENKQLSRTFLRSRKMGSQLSQSSITSVKTNTPPIREPKKTSSGTKNPYTSDITSMKV